MNLFKVLSLLSLLFSSNLFAGGPLENENVYIPRVLRGVKVLGREHVDITNEDPSMSLYRTIEGKFGCVPSSMDWSTYHLQNPVGLFWTEKETQEVINFALRMGKPLDFNPKKEGFSFTEDKLKRFIVKAGGFEINLWDAILKYSIDSDGILVITQ